MGAMLLPLPLPLDGPVIRAGGAPAIALTPVPTHGRIPRENP